MLKFNFRDLMIVLVPIIIFLLYLFVYNPGVLTVASYSQLHQIATGQFTSAHPILHTLIVMLFIKIFGNPFYIGLFQILIFSVMWMGICKYHRDDSAKSSNEFVAQFIITLVICLIPINAVYSITLSSYILFSYSIMFLCFLIKVMIDKNGLIDRNIFVLMALTIGIMSGLNSYGIAIAIPVLIATTYYLIKNGKSKNNNVMFVGLAIVCIFLIASLNFVCDVQKDEFNIPTDDAFNQDINIETAQNQFFSSINEEPTQNYEKAISANSQKGSYNILDSFVDLWRGNSILDILFNSPILYMVLSLMLLALIYVRTDAIEIFLVYVAPFLNTIIVILTGQNYLYSNILIFYLIAIICASFYFKPGLMDEYSNRSQAIAESETIQSQPQVQREETYEEDKYYSYLESEIEELTLDDISELLGENSPEEPQELSHASEGDEADLIDEILKEIESDKK